MQSAKQNSRQFLNALTRGRKTTRGLRGAKLIALLFAFVDISAVCAQESPEGILSYPYALETPEARRDRIENDRARVREFIARAKAGISNEPNAEDLAKQREKFATEQVFNDSSLQSGDIVSTGKELFIFRGRNDRERSPEDFIPLQNSSPSSTQRKP